MQDEACKICGEEVKLFDKGLVLDKYEARYDRCTHCGFMQIGNVTWLAEAYSEAIAEIDIGTVDRMMECSSITRVVLQAFFDPAGQFMDYGAGYGTFVRRMRDLGYDFRWYDTHCENIFAKRFEASTERTYSMVTAFEVVEHLERPIEEFRRILAMTPAFLFTTDLISQVPPALGTWPYYATETGQHVSFFTRRSLEILADRLGFHYATDGRSVHLMSKEKIGATRFTCVTRPLIRRLMNVALTRPTLLYADYEEGRRAVFARK